MKKYKFSAFLILLITVIQFQANSQSKKSLVWLKNSRGLPIFLYRFCNNQLQIEGITKKGKRLKNMSFSAKNATIIKFTKEGEVDLYPLDNDNAVVLKVLENGLLVDSLVLQIKGVPKPEIIIKYNNEVVNLKKGISLKGFTTGNLEIRIVKNNFDSFMPKDARFIFSNAKVTLAREIKAVWSKDLDHMGKPYYNLFPNMAQAKADDRLVIEVPELIRIDSQNNSHTIKFNSIYTIPLY